MLVASALSLAAAGGSVVVIRAVSTGPENVAAAALPAPVGSAVTARVPSGAGAGSADGAGTSGTTGTRTAAGQGGQADLGLVGGPTANGQPRRAPTVAAAAGQGEQGPLPAGALPEDGAVPGALASLRALAASRAVTTGLPHSPRLLNQLAGSAGWAGQHALPAPGSSGPTSAVTSSAAAAATATRASATRATATPATAAPATAASTVASPSAAATMPGLDVASYQHPVTSQYPHGAPVNWQQVAAAGYRFAAIKGTEGDYYVNPWVTTDLSGAKAAGLDVTPYHFAIPNGSSGQQQAEFAVEYSGYTPGAQTLPLMLDIEYDPYVASDGTNECYGLSASRETAWISAFVTTVRSLTGQYPIIYTTANWWDTCTGSSTAFGDDPMWVAAYGFDTPPMPAGWQDWSFWQYTSGGTVPGVNSPGTTDLDWFNPAAIGLIDPGPLASRPLTRVSVHLATLGALIGEQLSWTAAGLPPGVRIGQNGVLAGTITSTGSSLGAVTYQPHVTATNTTGASVTVTFDWQVAASCPELHITAGVCPEK
jgi:GH25 family lysozyme M1 (1,4-beta-N-acetylmuramidase)